MFAAETANAKAPKTQTNVGRAEREFILHLVQLKASRRFKATAALGRNTPVRGAQAWLKCVVVWGNVFIPPLLGATAKLLPCYGTQEGGQRILMYEAAVSTSCASTLGDAVGLPRFWLAVGTTAVLTLLGPVLWLCLAASDPAKKHVREREETVAFLVAGYEPKYRWWEVTVLFRKSAIYVVATWFPMSWAPGAHLVYLALIVATAELIHTTFQPYHSSLLDRIESQALCAALIGLLLVASLFIKWPFMPYAIYLTSCGMLCVVTAGAYLHFLFWGRFTI
ncbi:pmp10, partial [Symbiodinium natans]